MDNKPVHLVRRKDISNSTGINIARPSTNNIRISKTDAEDISGASALKVIEWKVI